MSFALSRCHDPCLGFSRSKSAQDAEEGNGVSLAIFKVGSVRPFLYLASEVVGVFFHFQKVQMMVSFGFLLTVCSEPKPVVCA